MKRIEDITIVGERMKTLRETAGLSQMKLAEMSGYGQSNIARYEKNNAVPPLKLLLWYGDHFDVSLDFIFGRTDAPQGKLYNYSPHIAATSEEIKKFIDMCFDPTSPVSEKMKSTLFEMFTKGDVEG